MPGGGVMKKTSIVWLGLILGLLLPFVAACAGGLPQAGSNSNLAARPAGDELYVLDSYTGAGHNQAAQHIVALPVGTTNPAALLTLPAGLTDLKHQRVYIASLSGGNGTVHTTISVLDTSSGAAVRTFNIPGSYSTADRGYADSMLSGDGRWLALRALNTPAGTTSIALVDTQAGKLVKSIRLNGDFTLDAVSPKGTMLYLLEYYQVGTSHYNVRAYNVNANQLLDGSIADKAELGEKMQGQALARQVCDDGDMAYTLYAANAALGLVATVNLDLGLNTYQLWLIGGARTNHFNPANRVVTAADQARVLHNGAALSRDQHMLYVAGLHGIWVINAQTLQVQSEYLQQQSFTGLAISGDGNTLYGVDPATGITLLDPSSGAIRSVIKGVVQAPWGIEWATA